MADPVIPTGWFESLVGVIVSGLVAWVGYVHNKLTQTVSHSHNMELDLARNYHTKEELRATMASAIQPLREDIHSLKEVVEKLRDSVPAPRSR